MPEFNFIYQHRDGVTRRMRGDWDEPDKFTVDTSMDLEPILKSAKRDSENHKSGTTNKLLARVPMTIYEKSMIEGWDEEDWRKWLNDPQNEPFRIWKGRV